MAVDAQTEAVFKSVRSGVDPVSGNDIPIGSTAENVRDDVPAMLSEGEYVVPADVVNYHGVKVFEDLRREAKEGFMDMAENGRIGGEPMDVNGMEIVEPEDDLPFDPSELQVVEAAEGTFIGDQGYSHAFVDSGKLEIKQYEGPDGQIIFVQFLNGRPLSYIPSDYREVGSAAEQVAEQVAEQTPQATQASARTGDGDDDTPPIEAPDPIDWKTATPDEFSKYLEQSGGLAPQMMKLASSTLGGPLVGAFTRLAMAHQDRRVLEGLDHQLDGLKAGPERARLSALRASFMESRDKNNDGKIDNSIERSGIFGGESGLLKNLNDMSGDGTTSFNDTWLGDLLGLDGKAGVQGPTLTESLQGARREQYDVLGEATPQPYTGEGSTEAFTGAGATAGGDTVVAEGAAAGKTMDELITEAGGTGSLVTGGGSFVADNNNDGDDDYFAPDGNTYNSYADYIAADNAKKAAEASKSSMFNEIMSGASSNNNNNNSSSSSSSSSSSGGGFGAAVSNAVSNIGSSIKSFFGFEDGGYVSTETKKGMMSKK